MGGEGGESSNNGIGIEQQKSVKSVLGKRNQLEMLEETKEESPCPPKRQRTDSHSLDDQDQEIKEESDDPKLNDDLKIDGENTLKTTAGSVVSTKENMETIVSTEMAKTRTFAVFVCGPDPTQDIADPNSPNLRGKTYVTLLSDPEADEKWVEYMIYRDQFPSKEELLTFDGIVITGSKHDAFTDDAPWKLKLCETIRDIYDHNESIKGNDGGGNGSMGSPQKGIKLLGICFGHQIMIQALTEKMEENFVGRNQKKTGLELGLMEIEMKDSFRAYCARFGITLDDKLGEVKTLSILEAHQDVVYKLPDLPDTEVMGSSPFTDVEMYHIGDYMMAVQGHPEFTTEYLSGAIKKNQKVMKLSDEQANAILKNLKDKDPSTKEWKSIFQKWLRA